MGEADEIVLNRRRPLIINGRKSIGLTSIFDDKGVLNSGTRDFLAKYLEVFSTWVKTNSKKR